MYEKFCTFCTNTGIKTKIFKTKPLQNTFLVIFLNVFFQNDKNLFSQLHYNREVATGAQKKSFRNLIRT